MVLWSRPALASGAGALGLAAASDVMGTPLLLERLETLLEPGQALDQLRQLHGQRVDAPRHGVGLRRIARDLRVRRHRLGDSGLRADDCVFADLDVADD